LCVTDLTDRSSAAEHRASLLAEQVNAEVLFVHATPVVLSQRVRRLNFARAHVRLSSRAERAMSHAPQGAKVSVRNGTLIQAIKDAACEWEPDLIVMARPRQRALDLILGTTAERVIRATRRPVLIVSATTQHKYRNVLLATDMSDVSVHVARTLMSMGMLEEAYTWIVHPLDAVAAYRQQWRRVLGAELLQRMSAEGVDLSRVDVVVEPARAIAALQKSLQTSHPELLVIGTGRWSRLKRILFESVADHVQRRVECDVLAIAPPARAGSSRATRAIGIFREEKTANDMAGF